MLINVPVLYLGMCSVRVRDEARAGTEGAHSHAGVARLQEGLQASTLQAITLQANTLQASTLQANTGVELEVPHYKLPQHGAAAALLAWRKEKG